MSEAGAWLIAFALLAVVTIAGVVVSIATDCVGC